MHMEGQILARVIANGKHLLNEPFIGTGCFSRPLRNDNLNDTKLPERAGIADSTFHRHVSLLLKRKPLKQARVANDR